MTVSDMSSDAEQVVEALKTPPKADEYCARCGVAWYIHPASADYQKSCRCEEHGIARQCKGFKHAD